MAESIAQWLGKLGLGRYAQAFADNGVELDHLPHLTDDDLKELGLPLGPRRHLQAAVQTLSANQPSIQPSTASAQAAGARPAEAERRQLTVLFCDLVGSTELSAKLDPEDLGHVIRAYHGVCAEVVERWGGHVAKYMGDGVLAYFGWPQAHEDEAERAVRAGLDLVAAVAGLATPDDTSLAARVGIATGRVVVGELIGAGTAQEEAVVGETPNLAARLQALAEPGSVVISQATRRLVGGLFDLADLGPRRLKGFAERLAAWRVEGEGRAEGRFEALRGERLTPLVGREHGLGILLERWEWAKDGEGQIVLLSGEPGIGKSRLTRSLIERLADGPHTRLRYYCSPYHTNSALYPVIDQMERAAGFQADDTADIKLDKLEAVLAQATEGVAAVAPLIAALLSIPTGGRYPPVKLTPEAQKLRTFEALIGQVEGLAGHRPVLMVFEDAQWIDPTSIELVGLLIDHIQRLPVLLLITFRPEFTPPWTGYAHLTPLTLSRLGQRQGAQMVERLTGGKPLPPEVLEQILAKTDGVPLFVEELTKTVLESGLLADKGDRYELSDPLPPLAIPATLLDSLMARLDRWAPVKEVAQIGAVIGREFSHELLAAVSPLPDEQLKTTLDQLVSSELVFRRGLPPDATYAFKHALVQDTAYQSLLKSRRQQLHARIAQALEQQFHEIARAQPEVLAHHCTQAGLVEPAVDYLYKAGRQAIARSAMVEAVAQLTQALGLLVSLPVGPDRDRKELDLQISLGAALTATRSWAAPEVEKTYSRARELCTEETPVSQLLAALSGLFVHHLNGSSQRIALEIAEELLRLAEQRQDRPAQAAGHRFMGVSLLWSGQLFPASKHFERFFALYDPADQTSPLYLWGVDNSVACNLFSAVILLIQGYPDRALARTREVLAAAYELRHAPTTSHALQFTSWVHQIRREPEVVQERAAALIALTARYGLQAWSPYALIFHGWAVAEGNATESGIAEMRQGLAAREAMGMQLHTPSILGLLAGIHIGIKNAAEALEVLDEALARAERYEERWFEAELLRLKGEALLAFSPDCSAEAEICYRQALAVAREQGAKLWELRAATSLARLWAEQDERRKAYDLLAPVYDWFTQGFDTADLKDAKALLDELA